MSKYLLMGVVALYLSIFHIFPLNMAMAEKIKYLSPMEEMVVTATRTMEKKSFLPQVMDVISKKEIKRTVGNDLTEVLKKNSSLDVYEYPGGYSGTISIRGVRSDYWGTNKHCAILIDGRPMGSTTLAPIDKNIIERVEILKGPASSLYGSDAMGGVVNIITKQSKGKIKTSLGMEGGSFNTWSADMVSGGNITDQLNFNISGSTRQQNDDIRMGNEHDRDHTSFKNYKGNAGFGLDINSQWRLAIKGNWFAGRDIKHPGDIDLGIAKQKTRDFDQYGGDLKLSGIIAQNNEIDLTIYTSSEENKYFYEFTGTTPYKGSWNHYNWVGAQLQGTHRWNIHSLTLGFDYQKIDEKGKSWKSNGTRKGPWRPDNERKTMSIFTQSMLKFVDDHLILTAGGRYNFIELKTLYTPYKTGFTPKSETFNAFNPSTGLKFIISPQWQVHSTIGTAFVAPKPEQVAGIWVNSWGSTIAGNSNLDPETSITWDAGISYIRDDLGLSCDLTYFKTDIDDKVEKIKVRNKYYTYENADTAQIRGLEGDFSFAPGQLLNLNSSIKFFANFTILLKAEEKLSTGQRDIRNIADRKANIGMEYDDGHFFNGCIMARYTGKKKDTDWAVKGSPEVENPCFTVVDISLGLHITENQHIKFQIDNVFDKYYYENKGYPLPGRSFFLKYTIDF